MSSRQRAARRRAIRRRRATAVAGLLALVTAAAFLGGEHDGGAPARAGEAKSPAVSKGVSAPSTSSAGRRAGSNSSVLPGPVLIADRDNNRLIEVSPAGRILWRFPTPGDLAPGETFKLPDDAFFSPDGRDVIVTQEDDFVISVIDVARGRIVYRYGHPGVPGSEPGYVHNPDDA